MFKIYSSHEDGFVRSPVISRAVQYFTPVENGERKNSLPSKEAEETGNISNHDPLINCGSGNGNVVSVDADLYYNTDSHTHHSDSVIGNSNESVLDAFTTISVNFLVCLILHVC